MRDHKDGGTPGDFLWVPVRYTGIRTYNCSGVARGSLSNAQDHYRTVLGRLHENNTIK